TTAPTTPSARNEVSWVFWPGFALGATSTAPLTQVTSVVAARGPGVLWAPCCVTSTTTTVPPPAATALGVCTSSASPGCPRCVATSPSSGAWAQKREGKERVGSTRNAIAKRNRRLFIANDDRALVVRAQARDRVSAGESGRGDSGRAREGRAEGQNEASGQLEADSGARTCQGIDTIAFSRLHLGINFPYATIAARRGRCSEAQRAGVCQAGGWRRGARALGP